MADVAQIRAGIATRLATIADLQVNDSPLEAIVPPTAVVGEVTVDYDLSFGRGLDAFTFKVRLYASRADVESGVDELDAFMSGSGARSVKAAVEADRTLGGAAHDCRVRTADNFGVYDVGSTAYLGVEFTISAQAKGATP